MNIHKKAKLTPLGRKRVSPRGQQMAYTLPSRSVLVQRELDFSGSCLRDNPNGLL